MKLGQKLYVGFAIPTICLAGLGFYSLISFANIDRQIGTIYDDRVVPLQQLKLISDDYAIAVIDAVNKAHAGRWTTTQALQSVRDAMQRIQENWQAYKQTDMTPEEETIARSVEQQLAIANQKIEQLERTLQNREPSQLDEFDGPLYDTIDPLTAQIQKLSDLQLQIARSEREKAAEVYQRTRQIFIPLLCLTLLLGLPIGFIIIKRALVATLKEIIDTLAVSSNEIASATQEQERIAQQQAGAIHQTSTAMEELNAASEKAASQAQISASGAKQALAVAGNGSETVAQTLAEMTKLKQKADLMRSRVEELSDRSSQIGNIAALVSELANQTSVLALNASVEAVRAGEYGKGFGVVASEIRKLADQSHRSAEKINALVADIEVALNSTVVASTESSESVEEGIRITRATAAAFDGVRDAVNQVFVSVGDISLNSQEQAFAIEQVVDAMNELNKGAAQSASGIGQVKVGTQRLSEVALHLQAIV